MSAAVAIGPLVGGLPVEGFGWRATFLLNMPLAIVATLFVLTNVSADPPLSAVRANTGRLDFAGIAIFAAWITSLVLFLLEAREQVDWLLLGTCVTLAAVLVCFESRQAKPFLDVKMLVRNGPLMRVYLRQALVFLGCYMLFYTFPHWLQDYRQLSPALIGLLLLPIPIASSIISWSLAGRLPSTQYMVGAAAMFFCGPLVLRMDGNPSYLLIVLMAVAMGLSTGATTQGNQQGMIASVPSEYLGTTAGMFRTFQYLGAILSACINAWLYVDKASSASMNGIGYALLPVSLGLFLLAWSDRQVGPPTGGAVR